MFGAILKATKSSFKKGMPLCRSMYVKKDMKLLAFIFEQPSYVCFNGFYALRARFGVDFLLEYIFLGE